MSDSDTFKDNFSSGDQPKQQSLDIGLRDDFDFQGFYPGANQQLFSALTNCRKTDDFQYLYWWGPKGSGKTHLLQGVCHAWAEQGLQTIYLRGDEIKHYNVGLLQGLDDLDLVCIDDMEAFAGLAQWEEAFFYLYNRLQLNRKTLLISADRAPKDLSLSLADLQSRLTSGLIFQLHELDDEGKIEVLKLRAKRRGFELGDDVAGFLLTRSQRDMGNLIEVLNRLDTHSLEEQRKVTIPFIKTVMGW